MDFFPLLKIVKIDFQLGCFLNRIDELVSELIELNTELVELTIDLDRFRIAIGNEAIRSQIVAC